MKGFGDWLGESKLGLDDIKVLREQTNNLGERWPRKFDKIGEYVEALQNIQCTRAKVAFYNLWPLYEDQERRHTRGISQTGIVVTVIAALLLYLIFYVLTHMDIQNLGGDSTRGVLAFLFGITTVGIVIMVVVAVFFEARETTLDDRFQRGKDILTILIGLLGAILGYYFGQAAGTKTPVETSATGKSSTGTSATGTSATATPATGTSATGQPSPAAPSN
jgi:hypothetical protein